MTNKKHPNALQVKWSKLTDGLRIFLSLFWQIIIGLKSFLYQIVSKYKRQLRPTKVNRQNNLKSPKLSLGRVFPVMLRKLKRLFSQRSQNFYGDSASLMQKIEKPIKHKKNTSSLLLNLRLKWMMLFPPKIKRKPWRWGKFILSFVMTFILTIQFTQLDWWLFPQKAQAAAVLKIEPLTWDFVGLDSNKPDAPDNQGPKDYMVGVRVCNMGNEPVRNVTVKYYNDGVDNGYTFINIATDTLFLDYLPPNLASIPNTIAQAFPGYIFETGGTANASKYDISFTPTNCADFYINFDVTRDKAAWHTTQKYYMEATAIDSSGATVGPVRTPQPRQIYIEQLISQARNSILDFYCDTPSGAGQRGTVNVGVGDVMICTAVGHTSTAYPQLSFTANFPNIIFQILDVNTTYTNPVGGVNSAVYADGCGWVQDPTSPDYHRSPTNCAGAGWPGQYVDNSGGEGTGLDVVTKYTVKVLSKPVAAGPVSVSNIILDFSGGSFHYNADYGTDICPTVNCINIIVGDDNSDLSITKSHTGNFTLGANQYTIKIQDDPPNGIPNNGVNAKDVKFYDTLPLGYTFNTADLIANDAPGQDGTKWYCTITDPSAFGGSDRSVVCNYNNATFLNKADDYIPDGTSQTLVFNVNVAVPPASTNSTNVACVSALNDVHGANFKHCDDDPTTIIFGPNIKLTKDDNNPTTPPFGAPDETFVAGGNQIYNFYVEKTTDAYNVNGPLTLVDTLPVGVSYVTNNGNDGWSCAANGQIVTCTRAAGLTGTTAQASSKTTFNMTVAVSLNAVDMDAGTAGVQVINTATVTSGSLDVNPNDNTDTQKNTVTIPAPDLTIDKTDNGLDFVNDVTVINSYVITIKNKSGAGVITTTAPLVFQDVLPVSLNLESAGNAPGSTGWTCVPSGVTVSPVTVNCTNPNPLPPGASTQIELKVKTNAATTPIVNSATVTTAGETVFDLGNDPANDPTNICSTVVGKNCDEEVTNVVSLPNNIPEIGATKTCPATLAPTGAPIPITYTIVIANNGSGNGQITNTGTLTDTFPSTFTPNAIPGAGFACAVTGAGNGAGSTACSASAPTYNAGTNTLTYNGYSLKKGGGAITLTITGTISSTFFGNIVNSVVVGPGAGILDSNPTNNYTTCVTQIPGPDLSIVKSSFSSFTVNTNSTYLLTVKNENPVSAPNNFSTGGELITVRDILPASLNFVSASGTGWVCSYNATNRQVLCTTSQNFAPQATSVINLTVQPNAAGAVTNAASVQYGGDPKDDKKTGYYTAPIGGNGATDDVNGNGVFDVGDDANSNDFDAKTTTVQAANVDLNITKTAQTAFGLGQQATYRINVANGNLPNPNPATAAIAPITVTDQLPPGVNFINASTVTGSVWVCSSTTDALPDNNNNGIVDAGDGNGTNDGFETVTCTRYTDIAPGTTGTFDLNVLVTASANTAAPITNNVRVTSSSDVCKDFTNGNCTDTNNTNAQPNDNKTTLNVNVTPASDLTIQKKAITQTSQLNPPQFLVSNTGQFEVTVVNNGPSAYSGGITFTDVLNGNFTFVSAGSGGNGFTCNNAGQTVTCTNPAASLTAGGSVIVKINVTVANAPTASIADTGADVAGDNITNTATITSPINNSSNIDNTNDSATAVVDLEPFVADLRLQKDDGDGDPPQKPADEPANAIDRAYFTTSTTPPPGGGTWKGSYTIEIVNNGPAIAAFPVRITDPLPAGLTFSSANGVGWNCSASAGQNIDCTYDINFDKNGDGVNNNNDDFLRLGENTGVEIIVNVSPTLLGPGGTDGSVTNTAAVTSTTPDSNNANNSNSEITIIRQAADLSVTKSDSADPVAIGGTPFTYTVTVYNDTPGYTGTVVGPIYATDYLPTGVVYNGGNTTPGTTVDIISSNTGTASCTWRLLTSGGNYVSFVCDDGVFGDANYPNLAFGSTSSFTFKVKVSDPNAQSIEKNLVRVGASIDEPDNPDEIICDRTDPPYQAPYTRQNPPPGRTNNCSIEPTQITGAKNANLVIVKQAGVANNDNPPAETLNNGDPFTYTFTVSNNGADDAQDVLLEDVLPAGVIPADANAGLPGIQITYTINAGHTTSTIPTLPAPTIVNRTCSYNAGANTFSCNLYTVSKTENAGGTGAIVITLNMKVNTASGTPSNEATLESSTSDNTQNNNCTVNSFANTAIVNCDQEVVQVGAIVQPIVDLGIVKTDNPDPVSVNSNLTYTLTVTNHHPTNNATNVVVTDNLPASVTYVSATPSQGTCSQAGGVVTCNLGVVNATANATITIVVTPTVTGTITNNVSVTSNNPEPAVDTHPNSDSEPTEVTGIATPTICYAVADGGNRLISINALTGVATGIGNTDSLLSAPSDPGNNIEAIAYYPTGIGTGILYGVQDINTAAVGPGQLGIINTTNGTFKYLPQNLGSGNGSSGVKVFDDVDGLTVDPYTGDMYGSVRDGDGIPPNDFLIKIDRTTGAHVPNAFDTNGDGVGDADYVVITDPDYPDIDDIAIDPYDGQLYGIANQNETSNDKFIKIDRQTGATTNVGTFGLQDVEGLTAFNDGNIYLTTGQDGKDGLGNLLTNKNNRFYRINKTTGVATVVSGDLSAFGTDYEGVACLTGDPNTITGTVFLDDNPQNGTKDGAEVTGAPNVTVTLYRDVNTNGVFDAGLDIPLTTRTTNATGFYTFQIAATGAFVLNIKTNQLPAGQALTTDNIEVANFGILGLGLTDADNNFGYNVGTAPDIILLKRITGVYRNSNPVITNPAQLFSQFNNDPSDPTDDPADWATNMWPSKDKNGNPPATPPENVYLRGAVDGGEVATGDEVEFTIYYVNKGGSSATNVRICDLIPNLNFVKDAYGSGKGMALMVEDGDNTFEQPIDYLTNTIGDADANPKKGDYFAPNTLPTNCQINDGGFRAMTAADNQYGAIAVDIGTIPHATAPATPPDSYGFIRFRAKVK